jgi:hypothetical protein
VVFGIGAFFAALALAVDTGRMWQARVEIRNSADAACLAAGLALVDDELLTAQPGIMNRCVERARAHAPAYAQVNLVVGQPLQLDANEQHEPLGDIVFGYLDEPRGAFHPASDLDDPAINAVRIIARRTHERGNPVSLFFARWLSLPAADVVATSTAMLDRDVIGFRPLANKSVPLMPIAVLSDDTLGNESAWECQVSRPLRAADALMIVRIPLTGEPESRQEPNGCFLQIGDADWEVLSRQIASGVTRADLAESGGQFVLGWDDRLLVPGYDQAPSLADQRLASLFLVLEHLQEFQEPRIWPLFAAIEDEDDRGELAVAVTGFVAARLHSVEIVEAGEGTEQDPVRRQLVLQLQPCMMSTGMAITDAGRRMVSPERDTQNPYICKVRLVE